MQQGSDVNVEERFGQVVEEARNLLDEHERWCAARVAAAEEAAQGEVARFEEASEQLARERRELADLEAERARLPFEAFRANMDGDGERESELRKRHREIKPEDLECLRDRCEALVAEMDSLGGTAHGAEKRAHGNARDTYASVLRSLETFEVQIDLLKEAVGEIGRSSGTVSAGSKSICSSCESSNGMNAARREARGRRPGASLGRRLVSRGAPTSSFAPRSSG